MTDDERRAIERATTDYFDSWFDGDPRRMARVLHPNLAKRRAADSGSALIEVPAADLIDDVASGPKTGYDRTYEIQVVDIGHDMASVVVHSDPFTEYLHLARFDDGWKIVNAFYRRNRPNQVPMIEPVLRLATLDDVDEIEALMKSSTRDLFPMFYDDAQTEASVRYIAAVDRSLIEEGTYFAMEANGELVACGGWSRRDKLYTGSGDAGGDARPLDPASEPARVRAMFVRADWTRRGLGTRILEACEAAARAEGFQTLALMSTLPGLPLYERFGFQILERVDIPLPNGTTIGGARMVMQLPSAGPLRQPPSSR